MNQLNQGIQDQAALMSFIDDIIKEKNEPNLTEGQRNNVKVAMLNELNEQINIHLVKKLSEKDQIELEQLLKSKASEKDLNQFFVQKIPNLMAEIGSVMANYRTAVLYELTAKEAPKEPTPVSDLPPAPVKNF
jgi:hypothetical protein